MKIRLKSFQLTRGAGFSNKQKKFGIVFMGSPQFACLSFEKLVEKERILAVVTQPDRPVGRGRKVQPTPIKEAAVKRKIPVYQPEKLMDTGFLTEIANLKPDLIVVVAFGKLLPPALLRIPRICCINLHPSLLPKYRGPAPIPWVLINGEKETGVSVQIVREKVDSGEIILQKEVSIDPDETAGELSERLSLLSAQALIEAIELIREGKARPHPQKGQVSHAPKITKEMSKINWDCPACVIHNLVRALNPTPGAYTAFSWRGRIYSLKIWKTALPENFSQNNDDSPGQVIRIHKDVGFLVKTGSGTLLIKEVQLPGKNKISAYDFVKGYHLKRGFLLGG